MSDENPFPAIDRLLRSGAKGGVIGYFSYDLFRFLEQYKDLKAVEDLSLPDCCLLAYDNVLIFDHQTRAWSGKAQLRPPRLRGCKIGRAESGMTRDHYMSGVEKALDYIAAGDIYQVNLAQRFTHSFEGSPFAFLRPAKCQSVLLWSIFELRRPHCAEFFAGIELEPVRRHVYTGAIGFFGQDDMRLSIAIRTMTVARGRLYYHVGSGIVADSDPAREYEETLDKAAGMRKAIERATTA